MELPISVMIMLFVAVVVGVAILGFASSTLRKADDDITRVIGNNGELGDKLVVVDEMSQGVVENLGKQCVRDYRGELQRKLCFVVNGKYNNIGDLHGKNYSLDDVVWKFNVKISVDDPNALFIYYNPRGSIDVES